MIKNYSIQPVVLFSLQLKLFDKLLDIEVFSTDDKLSVVQRVCKKNKVDLKYSEQIQQKIMNSLGKVLKQDSVAPALLNKVLHFLHKGTCLEENYQTSRQKNSEQNTNRATQSNILNTPERRRQQNQNQQGNLDDSLKNVQRFNRTMEIKSKRDSQYKRAERIYQLFDIPENEPYFAKNRRKLFQSEKPKQTQQKKINVSTFQDKSAKKKSITKANNQSPQDDLLRAYQNVLSKCRDLEMKERTKQFIDEFQNKNTPMKNKDTNITQYNSNKKQSIDNNKLKKTNEKSKQFNESTHKIKISDFSLSTTTKVKKPEQQVGNQNYNITSKKSTELTQRTRVENKNNILNDTTKIANTNQKGNYYLGKTRDIGEHRNSRSTSSITRKYNYLQQF